MFTKPDEKGGPREAETIIGPSVKVKGEFNGNGNIIVEGIFEGSLKTNSGIFIGDKAKVTAGIEANEATIGGEVTGNIKVAGHLEIRDKAKILGDIESSSLSVSKGAILNGKCSMINNKEKEAAAK